MSDGDRQPDGIHIVDAGGRVLRANLPTRKAGRTLARKLSRAGHPVYLVDPSFDTPVTPYAQGSQRGGSTIGTVPDAPTDTEPAPQPTDALVTTLPDLLRPGLDLVFVGINPGERSARRGHYYGHPGNVFWRMLSASPLVDGAVGPEDDSSLPERFGIGFTDVVKRVETDSTKVTRAEVRAARPAFEQRIGEAAPVAVCFNSATAFKAMYPRDWIAGAWGLQTVRLAGAEVWVMPSTSGLAAGVHSEIPPVLAAVAEALGRTREP